jgi:uncharacterized protein (DUF1330 family)
MTAIIVARITVINPEKMKAYSAAAASTVADHDGVFALRGKHIEALLGEDASDAVAIIQFPSASAAQGWFNSPEYQELQELRDSAAKMQFTLFELA